MLASELIEQLQQHIDREGDIEVTMEGTLLPDGYHMGKHKIGCGDVFESTVSTLLIQEKNETFEKRIRLFWQC